MKKNLHFIYQLLIIIPVFLSILVNLFWDHEKGLVFTWNIFSYFTFQSNLMVVIILILNLVYRNQTPVWLTALKSGVLIWILTTGLVYHFLLSSSSTHVGIFVWTNLILHYFSPLGMVLNWLIFEEKGQNRHSWNWIWIGYPVVYAIGAQIRGLIDSWYPYWFMNPRVPFEMSKGAGNIGVVALVVVILCVIFSIIGHLIVLTDRGLKKIKA
jgi:hypothetical protein